ncbi:hypothetical protein BDN72DRAFT_962220 [Pluteus cervinus]|uniref:Uncharacterized protein n=1 Tax=Pluteus cervinus TaxID=181527 RepID=A0ACD3AKS7_9AGAR|nr:hypothetical protein BDN72DRAFT_962220 [Pluteus cervinus]
MNHHPQLFFFNHHHRLLSKKSPQTMSSQYTSFNPVTDHPYATTYGGQQGTPLTDLPQPDGEEADISVESWNDWLYRLAQEAEEMLTTSPINYASNFDDSFSLPSNSKPILYPEGSGYSHRLLIPQEAPVINSRLEGCGWSNQIGGVVQAIPLVGELTPPYPLQLEEEGEAIRPADNLNKPFIGLPVEPPSFQCVEGPSVTDVTPTPPSLAIWPDSVHTGPLALHAGGAQVRAEWTRPLQPRDYAALEASRPDFVENSAKRSGMNQKGSANGTGRKLTPKQVTTGSLKPSLEKMRAMNS